MYTLIAFFLLSLVSLQFYADNYAQESSENKDSGIETINFFLSCLLLLLGRLDGKQFESVMSEYGMQISRVLISQVAMFVLYEKICCNYFLSGKQTCKISFDSSKVEKLVDNLTISGIISAKDFGEMVSSIHLHIYTTEIIPCDNFISTLLMLLISYWWYYLFMFGWSWLIMRLSCMLFE